jgi:hypothetical protein
MAQYLQDARLGCCMERPLAAAVVDAVRVPGCRLQQMVKCLTPPCTHTLHE